MSRVTKALCLLFTGGPRGALRRLRKRVSFSLNDALRVPEAPKTEEDLLFSVLVPLYNTPEKYLREMLDSLLAQAYGNWEVCLCDGSTDDAPARVVRSYSDKRIRYKRLEKNGGISENTNACAALAKGEYFVLLDHDDLLHPQALAWNAAKIAEEKADLLYSDEASFVSRGPLKILSFHYKPDFSPENLRANNYICHLSVFSRALWEKTGPFESAFDGSQDHDLILRLSARAQRIVHIPHALYLWRSHAGSVAKDIGAKPYVVSAAQQAVARAIEQQDGATADVESTPVHPTIFRVRYPVPPATVRVIALACPSYVNYSATFVQSPEEYQKAAEEAPEEYLLFLRAVTPRADLTSEMLSVAALKGVGAVGGTVRDKKDRLTDGGKLLSGGRVLTEHSGAPAGEPGYMGRLFYAHDVSALSERCLLLRRELFLSHWKPGFTLTDLCLALLSDGYRNVTDPYALCDEDGPDPFPTKTCGAASFCDPYFNPNFDPAAPDFRIT